jgi:DsbC/DsbD-like thiol-disulfide interchange protein
VQKECVWQQHSLRRPLNKTTLRLSAKLTVLLMFCLAGCQKPPADNPQSNASNTNEPPRIASVDVVEATPEELTLARGESGAAVVRLRIAKGYHVNANPPTFPYLKPTELEIKPASGISVQFIKYPDAINKQFDFAEKPLDVYEGETIVKANLKADKSAQPGKHNLSATLRVQACDDKVCYAPGARELIVPVNIK